MPPMATWMPFARSIANNSSYSAEPKPRPRAATLELAGPAVHNPDRAGIRIVGNRLHHQESPAITRDVVVRNVAALVPAREQQLRRPGHGLRRIRGDWHDHHLVAVAIEQLAAR